MSQRDAHLFHPAQYKITHPSVRATEALPLSLLASLVPSAHTFTNHTAFLTSSLAGFPFHLPPPRFPRITYKIKAIHNASESLDVVALNVYYAFDIFAGEKNIFFAQPTSAPLFPNAHSLNSQPPLRSINRIIHTLGHIKEKRGASGNLLTRICLWSTWGGRTPGKKTRMMEENKQLRWRWRGKTFHKWSWRLTIIKFATSHEEGLRYVCVCVCVIYGGIYVWMYSCGVFLKILTTAPKSKYFSFHERVDAFLFLVYILNESPRC